MKKRLCTHICNLYKPIPPQGAIKQENIFKPLCYFSHSIFSLLKCLYPTEMYTLWIKLHSSTKQMKCQQIIFIPCQKIKWLKKIPSDNTHMKKILKCFWALNSLYYCIVATESIISHLKDLPPQWSSSELSPQSSIPLHICSGWRHILLFLHLWGLVGGQRYLTEKEKKKNQSSSFGYTELCITILFLSSFFWNL